MSAEQPENLEAVRLARQAATADVQDRPGQLLSEHLAGAARVTA